MATISEDRKQAKVIDSHIFAGEALIWRRDTPRHEQTYRNNHFAPKNIFSNKRVSAIPGLWGLVVSQNAEDGWELCFAMQENNLIPDDVGKLLVVSPSCFAVSAKDTVSGIEGAGIPVIYDSTETFAWTSGPVVPSALFQRTRDRGYGHRLRFVWQGEVPADYIRVAEEQARHDGYRAAIGELSEHIRLFAFGTSWSGAEAVCHSLCKMSFGLLSESEFPKEPYNPRLSMAGKVTAYDYQPRDYSDEYRKQLEKAHDVVNVWEHALEAAGITLVNRWGTQEESEQLLMRVVETGRCLGFDSCMSAHLVDGVPLKDLFA